MLKKRLLVFIVSIGCLYLQGCATIYAHQTTEYQRHRPTFGSPPRQIRTWAFIGDLVMYPPLSFIIDFATGAIYRPEMRKVQIYHIDPPAEELHQN